MSRARIASAGQKEGPGDNPLTPGPLFFCAGFHQLTLPKTLHG